MKKHTHDRRIHCGSSAEEIWPTRGNHRARDHRMRLSLPHKDRELSIIN